MYFLDVAATLMALITLLAVVNARMLRMPSTIGVTIGGLMVSLLVSGLSALNFGPAVTAAHTMAEVAFNRIVFIAVLSFLLFAGALFLDSHELWNMRGAVSVFALISTLISTAVVGVAVYGMLHLLGLGIPLIYCLLFGSLISPTDPVAVLGMLKHAKVPTRIETLIAGESLFNDGIGVVLFTVLSAIAVGTEGGAGAAGAEHAGTSPADIALLFLREAGGGLLMGAVLGLVGLALLRLTNDYVTDVLVSLTVVVSLITLAFRFHVSAPLAAVAAGLVVGSMTDRVPKTLSNPQYFEGFWHLVDELLNLFLFAMLAFDLVVVTVEPSTVASAIGAIVIALGARAISVVLPAAVLSRARPFDPYTKRLMIWGGLRGALAVAMVFTLPSEAPRELFLGMTYAVVVFSLVVQGLTMGRLADRASAVAAGTP